MKATGEKSGIQIRLRIRTPLRIRNIAAKDKTIPEHSWDRPLIIEFTYSLFVGILKATGEKSGIQIRLRIKTLLRIRNTAAKDKTIPEHSWDRPLILHCTYELLVSLVNGEVPEGGGDGADDSVHLHAEEFHQDGQTLLLPYSRPNHAIILVPGNVPVFCIFRKFFRMLSMDTCVLRPLKTRAF